MIHWQVIGLIIGIVLFAVQQKKFVQIMAIAMIMTNAIAFNLYWITLLLDKKTGFTQKRRPVVIAYWSFIILIGALLGTVLGLTISSSLFAGSGSRFFRNNFFWFLKFCIPATAIVVILELSYDRLKQTIENKVKENEALKHLQVRTQLMALQAKVNPHFLFNTLNTMLSLVHKSPEKLETMILNLSDIYRKVLQFPELESIPLKEELVLVREYLEIERIRLGERLTYNIEVEPGLENRPVPPLLLEPVVENAVIHGIAPLSRGGSISIEVAQKESSMVISVIDNGAGIGDRKLENSSGFGLYSIRERLRLLYRDRGSFRITAAPGGGTCVTMEVPDES